MNFRQNMIRFLGIFSTYMAILPRSTEAISEGENTSSIVNFTTNLVNYLISDCYVMKVRNSGSMYFADSHLIFPVIDINFHEPNYTKVTDHLIYSSRHSLTTKHNRQCIVYYISLVGDLNGELDRLLEMFQIRSLQIEATFSYVIVGEYEDFNYATKFIKSPKLKSFQHRLLVENKKGDQHQIQTSDKDVGFKLKRYCYFCKEGGNHGFIDHDILYNTINELKGFQIFPDVTKNFNGKLMRVTAPPAPPLVLITPSKTTPGKNEIQGQHANILKSLAHHFNFSYRLYPAPGGLTGIKLANGNWNGIMGEILYDRADIGLSVATSYGRYQIVDVTVSVFYAFLVLVSTKPKPIFEWQAIFYPFKKNCWAAFIASTLFSFFASKWLHNHAIKYEIANSLRGKSKGEILRKIKREIMTTYKSFYITVGHLLEQGTPFEFDTTPSRTFVLFWMFFAMIITTAYRSKLFTFLTFPTVEVPPSTFLELAKSRYDYGMKHLGGIAFVFITQSPLKYIRHIGERMTVYNDKYSCLDRTFSDKFTCIIYRAYIDYMMEVRYWKIRHNFYISDFVTPPVGSAWVLPKYAAWLPEFDRVSYPIYEMGLADKYLYDYQVKIAKVLRAQAKATNSTADIFSLNSKYKGDDDGGPKPLVLANIYAAFFIVLLGTALGIATFLFEIFKYYNLKSKIESNRRGRLQVHLQRINAQRKRELPGGPRNLSLRQLARIVLPDNVDEII